MRIEKTHFLDTDAEIEGGAYTYRYEGDLYLIAFDRVVYKARTDSESPKTLHFLTRAKTNDSLFRKLFVKNRHHFTDIPYGETEFTACVMHFKNTLGFEHFTVLNSRKGDYQPLDLARLPS